MKKMKKWFINDIQSKEEELRVQSESNDDVRSV